MGSVTEPAVMAKLSGLARSGLELVAEKALLAWLLLTEADVPPAVRAALVAALLWLLAPVEPGGIPDFVPVLGLTDDAAVLAGAIALAEAHVTEAMRKKARERATSLLG